jgi:hypothetical protein
VRGVVLQFAYGYDPYSHWVAESRTTRSWSHLHPTPIARVYIQMYIA